MVRLLTSLFLLFLMGCSCPKSLPCTETSVVILPGKKDSVILRKPLVFIKDSVYCPPSDTPSVITRYLPCDCPPSVNTHQTDTIKTTVENKKLIGILRDSINALKKELESKQTVEKKSKNRIWWIVGLSLLALFFAYIIYKILIGVFLY